MLLWGIPKYVLKKHFNIDGPGVSGLLMRIPGFRFLAGKCTGAGGSLALQEAGMGARNLGSADASRWLHHLRHLGGCSAVQCMPACVLGSALNGGQSLM